MGGCGGEVVTGNRDAVVTVKVGGSGTQTRGTGGEVRLVVLGS